MQSFATSKDGIYSKGSQTPKLPWGLAWRIAIGQIVAWGILYYAFSVVIGPLQVGTGWSKTFVNGGLSLGLLVWGLCALPVGAWIQRKGGREIMTLGSLLGGGALVTMGSQANPAAYLICWIILGASMATLLYEPAFAVITEAFGPQYRRGITLITLVAGLASTVFVPLSNWIVETVGWQDALRILGTIQLLVGLPLHWWGLPPRTSVLPATDIVSPVHHRLKEWWVILFQDVRDPRFMGLALWFTSHVAAFSGLTFLLVPMYQSIQVDTGTLMKAIALIGPMQVAGRLLLVSKGDHFKVLSVGRWAMAALAGSTLVLLFLPPTLWWLLLFASLYGMGNGIMTILKGTAVAELFGRERYAELNGALSAPNVLAKAGTPFLLSALWSASSQPKAVVIGVLSILVIGYVGLELTRQTVSNFDERVAQ
jgi:MFS family permease